MQEAWQEKQDAALAAAITELANFTGSGLSAADKKKQKAELEARVALLEGHASSYNDAGPMLHCVVWHDGEVWRAAIDTHALHAPDSKEGLLADFTPMTNFRCVQHTVAALQCVWCDLFGVTSMRVDAETAQWPWDVVCWLMLVMPQK